MPAPLEPGTPDAPGAAPAVLQGRALQLRLWKANAALFAVECLGIELGPHLVEWANLLNSHLLLSILAARGHGKSGFFSYAVPLWKSWRSPNTLGLLISDTDAQVAEFLRIMKEGKTHVDPDGHEWTLRAACDVPELQSLLPYDYDRSWTGERLAFNNGSRITGKTFGKRFRGRHVQWIGVDDPLGDENQWSELARKRDQAFFMRAVLPMLLPGGQLWCTGTPMHDDDLHSALGKNAGFVQRRYPAITEVDGREVALWPKFRSLEWLHGRLEAMGVIEFGQEYLLRPASNEATLFPASLFTGEVLSEHGFGLRGIDLAAAGFTCYAGVDLALSAAAGADYTVIVVLAVDATGVRWLVYLSRTKGLAFNAQLALIEQVARRFDCESVFIEANQAQRVFGDELARLTDLPIVKFTTTAGGKNSLESGVPGLRTLFEGAKLRLARGDAEARAATDILIAELGGFGWHDGKLQCVGSHDDTVMALWICDQAIRSAARFGYLMAGRDRQVPTTTPAVAVVAAQQRASAQPDGKVADEPPATFDFGSLRTTASTEDAPPAPRGPGRYFNHAGAEWDDDEDEPPVDDGGLQAIDDVLLPVSPALLWRCWNALTGVGDPPPILAAALASAARSRVRSAVAQALGMPG